MNLKHFLLIGKIEGISSLLLFCVAMPLKYLADISGPVSSVGMAHGVLFLIYITSVLFIGFKYSWKVSSFALLALASILPGGPLYLDPFVIKREEKIG